MSTLRADTRVRCEHCGAVLSRSHKPLTEKQAKLYRYIANYIEAHHFAPSFTDISDEFGYTSLATVHEHLFNLERKGWIRRRFNEARSIEALVEL